MSDKSALPKVVDEVSYIPIDGTRNFWEKRFMPTWDVYVKKMLPEARHLVEELQPDIIHIFGAEWPFGQIAAYTDIPVVIHIMGSIVPYNNAVFPPKYSCRDIALQYWWNPRKLFSLWRDERDRKDREKLERSTWKYVQNYMGRTQWDCSLSRVMHPGRRYFHVEEALRSVFITGNKRWHLKDGDKIRLISTGCSTFWKGPDMMLKVARILTKLGIDFEWNVVGAMDKFLKNIIEQKEGTRFEDCHIKILGFKNPEDFIDLLCSSTLYVHTAYIENSPNSICEAQCLGIPVVSTNVGGISTLVRHGEDGILVPANDPWQMADAIIELSKDKERLLHYSDNSRLSALARHHDETIKTQLLACYNTLISER